MNQNDLNFIEAKRAGLGAHAVRIYLHRAINDRAPRREHGLWAAYRPTATMLEVLEIQKQSNALQNLLYEHLWRTMSEEERAEYRLRTEFPEYLDVLDAEIIG